MDALLGVEGEGYLTRITELYRDAHVLFEDTKSGETLIEIAFFLERLEFQFLTFQQALPFCNIA